MFVKTVYTVDFSNFNNGFRYSAKMWFIIHDEIIIDIIGN